jgi:hypothetical protein
LRRNVRNVRITALADKMGNKRDASGLSRSSAGRLPIWSAAEDRQELI